VKESVVEYYTMENTLNVYLACASLGLAAWFNNCNKPALQKILSLPPHPRAFFGQPIGYAED